MEGLRQTSRIHASWGHETVVASCDADQAFKQPDDSFELVPLGPGKYGWAYSQRVYDWLLKNLDTFDLAIMHGLWLYPSKCISRVHRELKRNKNPAQLVMTEIMNSLHGKTIINPTETETLTYIQIMLFFWIVGCCSILIVG